MTKDVIKSACTAADDMLGKYLDLSNFEVMLRQAIREAYLKGYAQAKQDMSDPT